MIRRWNEGSVRSLRSMWCICGYGNIIHINNNTHCTIYHIFFISILSRVNKLCCHSWNLQWTIHIVYYWHCFITDERQFHGIFAERSCLRYVKSPRTVCDGNTLLSFTSYFYSQNGPQLYQDTLNMLQKPKTLLFTGIGFHVHFNHESVCTQYIKPIAQLLQDKKSLWPKLLWLEVNAPGFVLAPEDYDKVVADVKVFNKKLEECLQSYKTPILKTYNMSSDLLSFDGVHYGFGFNSMKINLLLSFLREWRESGDW